MEQNASNVTNFESGIQLFHRYEDFPSIKFPEKSLFNTLFHNDIVEITGESCSGKSELLYHLIAQCILPPSWRSLETNGISADVTFIDNDNHFDIFRLVVILEKQLLVLKNKYNRVDLNDDDVSSFVMERLQHLNVLQCYNSDQFIISLCSLEHTLRLKRTKNIIMIDSISSFYWVNRMHSLFQLKKLDEHYAKIVSVLVKLSKNCSAPIILTKQKLMNFDGKSSSDYDVLGRGWKNIVTYRIELKLKCFEKNQTLVSLNLYSKKGNCTSKFCAVTEYGFRFL